MKFGKKGRGWFNHPYEHKLASHGIQTSTDYKLDIPDRREISEDLLEKTLEKSEYIDVTGVNEEFSTVDFIFGLNGREREIKGSLEYSHLLEGLLRYPELKNKSEIYDLEKVVDKIDEQTPFDVSIEFKYWDKSVGRRDKPKGATPSKAESLLDKDLDIYPHIFIINPRKVEKPKRVYDFVENFTEIVTDIGNYMEESR